MKTILSILLALCMAASVFAIPASAAGSAVIRADAVTADPNGTVTVALTITNNPGILGAAISIAYPDELTLTDASGGDAFSMLSMTKPGVYESPCNFLWDGQEITADQVRDGVILTLTFAISASAKEGAVYSVSVSVLDAVDNDLKSVSVTAMNGSVTISGKASGHTVKVTGGTADKATAEKGETVTITAGEAPDGKTFDKWVVKAGGVTPADASAARTTFVMGDADVQIEAVWKSASSGETQPSPGGSDPSPGGSGTTPGGSGTTPGGSGTTPGGSGTTPMNNPFRDVLTEDYFYDPVLWAVQNKITAGTTETTFGPYEACTRGQIVTFLWRAAGSPEPKSSKNPFTDVTKEDYFYKAVLWAVEKGVTAGLTPTVFGSNDPCTRAQAVTFLWRAAGSPKPTSTRNPFTDLDTSEYYMNAVLWAVGKGITAGTTPTTFGPNEGCVRAQIVTFLYRSENK